ncbi:MAG: MFS transporter [Pseudomonadota bacterium]|uniref:MFS transporter n=1 Tax=Sphingomonas sp. ERG5 TaxID=1381597 RepID=UPI00054C07CD|nr:MFS transporter [Sphingomonas sp. ERG5]
MEQQKHSIGYQWYVVILLLLVYILSYFDRYILTLVIEPIKHSLQLNDFQVGLLLGPAFSLFNVLMGIPLGWYADRASRKWILIGGIVFWCAMTTASGFAMSFAVLLLLRLGLGLGEAVVSPASISMISDYFDRRRRGRAISIYMAGPYLGAGLAFLVGGNLVGWLTSMGHTHFLGVGPFEVWQMAFFLVGIPGFIFAALMLTIREPARTERVAKEGAAPQISAFRYILQRWRGFGALFVGATCNFAMSTLTFWNIPLFQRVWGWDIPTIGTVTGLFYFTAGPIGTAIAVWMTRHLLRTHADAAMRVLLLGLAIGIPMSALYPVMPTASLAVTAMFIAFVGKSIATAGGPSALALVTPGDIRSQSVAIFNTVITLVGPLLGPPIIGWATDYSGDPRSIGMVLSLFVICIGIPSILFVVLGMKHYRQALVEMEESLAVPDALSAPATA